MISDIVERLTTPGEWIAVVSGCYSGNNSAPFEAANEIKRLREAILKWVKITDDLAGFDGDRRGIVHALIAQENVMRKLVGARELAVDD